MNELRKLKSWAKEIESTIGVETKVTDETEEGIRQGTIDEGERYYSVESGGARFGSITAYSNGTYYLYIYETDEDMELFF